jgi:hypothetical protein
VVVCGWIPDKYLLGGEDKRASFKIKKEADERRWRGAEICTGANPGTNVASQDASGVYPPHPVPMPSFVPKAKILDTDEKSCEGQMADSLVVEIRSNRSDILSLCTYYSLRFRIRSRLGERHGHQSTTLTSLFYYTNIYWRVMYILMKVIFKTNLFIWFSHFQTQWIKSYSWFIFSIFDSNLV